jgi:hypothetical protein
MHDDQGDPDAWDDYAYSGNAWGFRRPYPNREARVPDGNQVKIEREIVIKVTEDLDAQEMDIVITTPDMPTVEVIGLMEMAKKQYIESRHTTGPTTYQAPTDAEGLWGSNE